MHRPWRRGQCSRPESGETARIIYKRYEFPDGSVEELTREEFDNVVDVFRMLLEADSKLKRQFESLSHQACGSNKEVSMLEPDKSEILENS